MHPPVFLTLFRPALAGLALLPQLGFAAPAVPWEVFATDSLCGQVLALTVDDTGQVQAAVTTRAFGRGTLVPDAKAAWLVEDRALYSMAGREALAKSWQERGLLEPPPRERAAFFPEGTADFLTRYEESIVWLKDADGDGKAEERVVVADGFRAAGDGPGSALLARRGGGWLYGGAPRLWLLPDRNGDGRAEGSRVLIEGPGLRYHPEAHGLHTLLEAADGWIYFTTGDRGYRVRDGQGAVRRGLGSGAVFRCRPDGSALEVVATGLRNPTGLAMTSSGQLFALETAAPGNQTRLLLILPGANFGWQAESISGAEQGPWFREGMGLLTTVPPSPEQAVWALPPLAGWPGVASSLECLADGTLLAGDASGKETGGLFSLTLAAQGAGFHLTERTPVWQGGAVLATTQDLEGRVLLANWSHPVDAFSRCRIERGRPGPPVVFPEPPTVLLKEKIPRFAIKELKALLGHPSLRVRLRARQRLAGMSFQDSMEALLEVARRGPSREARLESLWGAGTVAQQEPALFNELPVFLDDEDAAIRATTARVLGEGPRGSAPTALRRALTDRAPEVRLAAAASVARLQPRNILTDLLQAAAANSAGDPWLRHSLAHALAVCVPAPALTEPSRLPESPEVRLTVVLALRRQATAGVVNFLAEPDPVVRTEAARAVYDLPLFTAFPALSGLLDPNGTGTAPLPEATVRRALAAALHFGTAAEANRVAALAKNTAYPTALRLEALTTLESWDTPPAVEAIWNRPSFSLPRLPGVARAALREAAEFMQNDPMPVLAARAKTLANSPALAKPRAAACLAVCRDPKRTAEERLAALQTLIAREELNAETAKLLTAPMLPPAVRAEARSWLMRHDPREAPTWLNDAFTTGTMAEKQAALKTMDRLPGHDNENEKLLLDWSRRLGQGGIESGVQVEMLEALQRRDIETRSPWRRAMDSWTASLPMHTDPLAAWRMATAEGDPAAGRLIFEGHPEANCTRCHSLQGVGGTLGPDLDGVASRLEPGDLLEALVHPSAKLTKGYAPAAATGSDEDDPTESAPGALAPAGEAGAPLSIMPPAGSILTLRELRDLISYLGTLH